MSDRYDLDGHDDRGYPIYSVMPSAAFPPPGEEEGLEVSFNFDEWKWEVRNRCTDGIVFSHCCLGKALSEAMWATDY